MTNTMTDRFAHFFTSPRRPIGTVSFAEECTDPDTCYPTDTGEDDMTDPNSPPQQPGFTNAIPTGQFGGSDACGGFDSVLFRLRRTMVDTVRIPVLVSAG
ncbi:MAG: hypothetical protein K0U98_08140 [Deltaproteobacteria bacterium]|nr:hypothetical protein [Deltaproteobacteria bacterium]